MLEVRRAVADKVRPFLRIFSWDYIDGATGLRRVDMLRTTDHLPARRNKAGLIIH